ncbi:MAG TPA: UDP-N-acetylmuramate--L-alanine ligase [Candidatus Marinimicrobia bacterium]|nr:UDP-N-acetylmuramate--L-alanine ligase [Candidatus Neomarinimicrobiota bacterium]
MKMFGKIKNIHFIGIGGIGMCGLAELLTHWNFSITGSDARYSDNVARLGKLGIKIFSGHYAKNIQDYDAVVYTSAIGPKNPEFLEAKKRGIPVIKRAKMLGEILRLRPNSIAIAGTHGKTTTTSLVGHIFSEAGRDPIVIAGGIFKQSGSTIRIGSGDTIIVEADEYDHSFLQLYPTHAIITTIESEHLDIYGTLENIKRNFIIFANRLPFYGKLIVSADDKNIQSILPDLTVPFYQYSTEQPSIIHASNIRFTGNGSDFEVVYQNQQLGAIRLPLPGIHNINNALAAIAMGLEYGIDFNTIATALGNFSGVERRFDIICQSDALMLVDDYAHHPTEIAATLKAAKDNWNRRVIAVFQPHLYSRTQSFYKNFAEALKPADILILLDVYPAREEPIPGVSGKLVYDELTSMAHRDVHYFQNMEDVPSYVKSIYKHGDMIITLGAGDVNKLHKSFQAQLNDNPDYCNE